MGDTTRAVRNAVHYNGQEKCNTDSHKTSSRPGRAIKIEIHQLCLQDTSKKVCSLTQRRRGVVFHQSQMPLMTP